MSKINKNGLEISSEIFEFINNKAIPGTNIDIENFWQKFSDVVHELAPVNKELIQKREIIQKKIDDWHKNHSKEEFNKNDYIKFLKSIGYLVEEKSSFNIETANIDNEISSIAGPQLVVPVDNARYALNAANARWGSLYDALYGTDIIPGNIGKEWDKERAKKVIDYVRTFFDKRFPLIQSNWNEISKIHIEDNKLVLSSNTKKDYLKFCDQVLGYTGSK